MVIKCFVFIVFLFSSHLKNGKDRMLAVGDMLKAIFFFIWYSIVKVCMVVLLNFETLTAKSNFVFYLLREVVSFQFLCNCNHRV